MGNKIFFIIFSQLVLLKLVFHFHISISNIKLSSLSFSSLLLSFFINHEEIVAVKNPKNMTPDIIITTVITLPPIVTGVISPNPTVVIVIITYHNASKILLICVFTPTSKR